MYITVKKAAKNLEIYDWRVRKRKITSAYQKGKTWKIPFDTQNPLMKDIKLKNHSSLLLNTN